MQQAKSAASPRKRFSWGIMKKKRVYSFLEGSPEDIALLGQKGCLLSEIYRMDLPVPPGFIIIADNSKNASSPENRDLEKISEEYRKAIKDMERQTRRKFGGNLGNTIEAPASSIHPFVTISNRGPSPSPRKRHDSQYHSETTNSPRDMPLLLSVRSSPIISMPGACDCILNIGMSEELAHQLARTVDNPRWAYETYRHFLQMFGTNVYGICPSKYRKIMSQARMEAGVASDNLLGIPELLNIISEFKRLANIPQDPWEQLELAIMSMYKSWNSFKGDRYRDLYGVNNNNSMNSGVAIIVQSMVFGSINERCGVGVAYTRHPNTGDKVFFAEFMPNAIGEEMLSPGDFKRLDDIRDEFSGLYHNLVNTLHSIERHFRDMMEVHFTVEDGNLFILEVKPACRSATSAVSVAVHMVKEKVITEREALMRLDPLQMMYCVTPVLPDKYKDLNAADVIDKVVGVGQPCSLGVASGKIVFSSKEAIEMRSRGEQCILCLQHATLDDAAGMEAAAGVISLRGGITSHSAVWLRGCGKTAISNLHNVTIDPKARSITFGNNGPLSIDEIFTMDGSTGAIFLGEIPTEPATRSDEYSTIMSWARKYKTMNVLSTVHTPEDAIESFCIGADGIGICKTEHMFLGPSRLDLTRFIMFTDSDADRAAALSKLQDLHVDDLLAIFRASGDRDIVVRMLDISLHAAIPDPFSLSYQREIEDMADSLDMEPSSLLEKVEDLVEINPILGVRGCRLAFVQPHFATMQARAIAKATVMAKSEGINVNTKIMLPVSFSEKEVERLLPLINESMSEMCAQMVLISDYKDYKIDLELGVDIANPRACYRTSSIANNKNIGFITLDTDELTQLAFGITREQSTKYLSMYVDKHILSRDPFTCIDTNGVGKLLESTISSAKRVRKDMKINVSGLHTADPLSVRYFESIGVDTITVAHNEWIPVATVAAAQSVINPNLMRISKFAYPFGKYYE